MNNIVFFVVVFLQKDSTCTGPNDSQQHCCFFTPFGIIKLSLLTFIHSTEYMYYSSWKMSQHDDKILTCFTNRLYVVFLMN